MPKLVLAKRIAADFSRILGHLEALKVENADEQIETIVTAIDVLASNPRIGRPTSSNKRELVIGHGASGYIALYLFKEAANEVHVLAIRAQREAGYGRLLSAVTKPRK